MSRTSRPQPGQWLVLVWRLPTGGSTSRVAIWRGLRKLGGVSLTPGAAILPQREELREQLDWIAQEVDGYGGDAWVLVVTDLSAGDEARVLERMRAERAQEYAEVREAAMKFLRRAPEHPGPHDDYHDRLRTEKELVSLQRRFQKVRSRDHVRAPGRVEAASMIDRCLAFRQGISRKLMPVTDTHDA